MRFTCTGITVSIENKKLQRVAAEESEAHLLFAVRVLSSKLCINSRQAKIAVSMCVQDTHKLLDLVLIPIGRFGPSPTIAFSFLPFIVALKRFVIDAVVTYVIVIGVCFLVVVSF
jgi:hypothetical protein